MQTQLNFPGLWEIGFQNRFAKAKFCANAAQFLPPLTGLTLQEKVATRTLKKASKFGNDRAASDDYHEKPSDDNRWWKKELTTKETTGVYDSLLVVRGKLKQECAYNSLLVYILGVVATFSKFISWAKSLCKPENKWIWDALTELNTTGYLFGLLNCQLLFSKTHFTFFRACADLSVSKVYKNATDTSF